MADDELSKYRRLLRDLIGASPYTAREVERRLGLANGTLGSILSGRRAMKLTHLLDVLRVLGFSPRTFFAILYGNLEPEQGDLTAEILRRLADMGYRDLPPPPLAVSDDELDRRVERALRQLLLKGSLTPGEV